MELFDTSKVNAVLKQLRSRIRQSAPAYQSRLLLADELLTRVSALRQEMGSLNDLISKEMRFLSTRSDQLRQAQLEIEHSMADFDAARSKFQALALRQAAMSGPQVPLVFQFCGIEGATPLTDRNRLEARRIELRAKLMRKVDRLRSLRRRVFCLRNDCLSDYRLDDVAECPEEDSIGSVCQDVLDVCDHQFMPQPAVSAKLFECLSDLLHPAPPLDAVDFDVLRFARPPPLSLIPPQGSADEPSPVGSAKEETSSLLGWFYQQRAVAPRGHGSRVFASYEMLPRASRQLNDTQTTINQLSGVLSCNTGIPLDIWETEHRLHSRMVTLIQEIDSAIDKASSRQQRGSIAPFGYEKADAIVVDEPLHAQIERCSVLVARLQADLLAAECTGSPYLEQLTDTVSAVRQPAETPCLPEPERPSQNGAQARLSELLSDLLARQRRDLNTLSAAVRSLPDQLQHQFGDFSLSLPAIPSIKLPPRLDGAIAPPPPPVSSAVAKSNAHLLERIQANLILRPQMASQEPAAPKQTSDHRLRKMIDRWKDLITEAGNPTEMNALLRQRAAIEGELRDAEARLEQRKKKQRRQAKRNSKVRLATDALRRKRDEKIAELGVATNKRDRVRARQEAVQTRLAELQAELEELTPIVEASRATRREIDLVTKQIEEFERLTAELNEKF
jgi:hypothetical protein